ncbi:hypothetical protein [Dactylosporangium sp. CA-233914]|uniref:hypothetical protein n=1 Tax=Dactylosporangium sp. CA-233914 TaxID=3239934 RepID=UPI003D90D141
MEFEVQSAERLVWARSVRRLAFEPHGWQVEFREALRTALEALPRTASGALLATYDAPDSSTVDVENVLLYNVGTGVFRRLVAGGVTCRRGRSGDGWHHVRYEVVDEAPASGGAATVACAAVEMGDRLPQTAGGFWAALRPGLQRLGPPLPADTRFTVDLTVSGPAAADRLAAMTKPLLDGWISAVHCHDGSAREELVPRLAELGDPSKVWAQLCDAAAAMLDTRTLVRPFRDGVAWNPADDRCDAFRILPRPQRSWSVTGALRAAA